MNNNYIINGFNVKYTYTGIDQYTIYKDKKEICTCWSISDVAKLTHTDAETVKEEMWKQRY